MHLSIEDIHIGGFTFPGYDYTKCNDCSDKITRTGDGLVVDGVIVCNTCFIHSGHYTTDNMEKIEFLTLNMLDKWDPLD